jgi:hypothetical protein
MVGQPAQVQLKLHADSRLAAAAGGVARYFADAAGLESEPCVQLQMAVVAACEESFEQFADDGAQLAVTLERFADRIEVSLTHQGTVPPAAGLHTLAGFAGMAGDSRKSVLVALDRVQFETQGNSATTRLTKFWVLPGTPQ